MNPYEVLGVDRDATVEDIKKVYRKLSKQHHPDMKDGDAEKFKEIASAYEILSDPQKKEQYDMFGSTGQQGGNPFSGGGNPFGDMFSSMFGSANPFARQRAKRGSDVGVSVQMTLVDIITGANKKITYTKDVSCTPCSGRGGSSSDKCIQCGGSGQIVEIHQTAFGIQQRVSPCSCNGGYIVKDPCKVCNGSGVTKVSETITTAIPAGVAGGMQLNMQGAGNAIRDGITGDLIIRINEIADPNFRREGNNLNTDVWISISDAVLGASKNVKYPMGELKFNIEPGCESGKVYNFSGKGIPNIGQDGRSYGNGNMFVKVNVTIPKVISEEAKNLFEELKKH
jgi:molecular chaperone DnaJ